MPSKTDSMRSLSSPSTIEPIRPASHTSEDAPSAAEIAPRAANHPGDSLRLQARAEQAERGRARDRVRPGVDAELAVERHACATGSCSARGRGARRSRGPRGRWPAAGARRARPHSAARASRRSRARALRRPRAPARPRRRAPARTRCRRARRAPRGPSAARPPPRRDGRAGGGRGRGGRGARPGAGSRTSSPKKRSAVASSCSASDEVSLRRPARRRERPTRSRRASCGWSRSDRRPPSPSRRGLGRRRAVRARRATSASVVRATTRLGTRRSMSGCSRTRSATADASSSSPAKKSARA